MHHRLAAVGAAMTLSTICLAVMAAVVLVTLAPGARAAAREQPTCDALAAPAPVVAFALPA